MVKDILEGTKEVLVEITTGMVESCQSITVGASKIFADLEVKLMGSYEEIEAFAKAKEAVKIAK